MVHTMIRKVALDSEYTSCRSTIPGYDDDKFPQGSNFLTSPHAVPAIKLVEISDMASMIQSILGFD
jgi:hypothetical protein